MYCATVCPGTGVTTGSMLLTFIYRQDKYMETIGSTRRKYVSAGNGAVEVHPTRIHMTRTNELIVHEIGSDKQQHRKQFPQFTIFERK